MLPRSHPAGNPPQAASGIESSVQSMRAAGRSRRGGHTIT